MRKLHFISLILLALAAAPQVRAQTAQKFLLPENFGTWEHKESQHTSSRIMWPRTPEMAALDSNPDYTKLLVENGVVKVEERNYGNAAGSEVGVRLFQFRDPSSAYEVYTNKLHPGMVPSFIANNSAVDGKNLWLLTGNLVLDVASQQNATETDLKTLVKLLEGHVEHTPLPPIRSYLPEYGLVSGTQRYALGPLGFRAALKSLHQEEFDFLTNEIGFDIPSEAMLAQYQSKNGTGVLLLLEYPNQQLAENHRFHLESALTAAGKKSVAEIQRKGSLLSLALSPTSDAFAKALRTSANYEMAVTWNEPSQTLTDPPITSMLAKIFIGTGVFMIIAVALGVAFGGVRVITKRLFPGKVFDRPQDIEVLQMGLSGKKIDPSDMY